MNALTGTWRLVRLAMRRDRIKLPIVVLVLGLVFFSSVAATIDLYSEPEQQLAYAATTAPSVVGRVFAGPLAGPELGAIVMNETFLFTAVAVAFMSTLTIVRHTRQNEEFGRSELIESGVVSRHASLVAALIVALIANIAFGGIAYLSLVTNGLSSVGAMANGLAFVCVGIAFAGIAAICAQLADSARGANSFCALVIGVAFLLRAVGDSTGNLAQSGLAVTPTFPSWLSPLGWAHQVRPFTDNNWWVLGLLLALFLVTTIVSLVFMSRRDIGLGMITTRPGPARAPAQLLSAFGLAVRLQKGILRGWAIAILVLAVSYGLVIKEFEGLISSNEQFQEAFAGVEGNINDTFLGVLIGFMAITITGYAVQAVLRMRAEEANGQLESVLGTGISRTRWLFSHLLFVFFGIMVLTLLTAFGMGITYILSTSGSWGELWGIVAATLVQSSAIIAYIGFVVAIFGVLPNFSVPIGWAGFSACLLILQLGVLLNLPEWVLNISPFGHLPSMPAESFELVPVVGLLVVGALLTTIGLISFRRRDIQVV